MKTKIIQDLFNTLQCIGLYFRLWKRVWGLAARAWKQDYASSEASTSQPGQKLFLTSDGEATFWKVPLICIWALLKGRRGTGHFLERCFPYQLSIAKPPPNSMDFQIFSGTYEWSIADRAHQSLPSRPKGQNRPRRLEESEPILMTWTG